MIFHSCTARSYKKRGDKAEALPPCFFNKANDVTLERFGEWVCACRSSSASLRRITALWHPQQQMKKNSRPSGHPSASREGNPSV